MGPTDLDPTDLNPTDLDPMDSDPPDLDPADLNPTDAERAQIRYEDQLKNYSGVVKAHANRITEISKAVSILLEKLLYLVLDMTEDTSENNKSISLKTILDTPSSLCTEQRSALCCI